MVNSRLTILKIAKSVATKQQIDFGVAKQPNILVFQTEITLITVQLSYNTIA
jgi:hypothetical protein